MISIEVQKVLDKLTEDKGCWGCFGTGLYHPVLSGAGIAPNCYCWYKGGPHINYDTFKERKIFQPKFNLYHPICFCGRKHIGIYYEKGRNLIQ